MTIGMTVLHMAFIAFGICGWLFFFWSREEYAADILEEQKKWAFRCRKIAEERDEFSEELDKIKGERRSRND